MPLAPPHHAEGGVSRVSSPPFCSTPLHHLHHVPPPLPIHPQPHLRPHPPHPPPLSRHQKPALTKAQSHLQAQPSTVTHYSIMNHSPSVTCYPSLTLTSWRGSFHILVTPSGTTPLLTAPSDLALPGDLFCSHRVILHYTPVVSHLTFLIHSSHYLLHLSLLYIFLFLQTSFLSPFCFS